MKKGLPLFLFLVFAVFVWVAANSADKLTIDDHHIQALLPDSDPASNGMQYISHLLEGDTYTLESENKSKLREHVDLNAWDDVFASRVLGSLEPHLAKIELAANSSYIGFTPPDNPYDLPLFEKSVNLNRLLLLKSMVHLKEAETDEAISQLALSLKFSESIRRSHSSTLINYMVGDAMLFHTFRWAHHLASAVDLTGHQYQVLLHAIAGVNNFENDGFREVFVGEYMYVTQFFTGESTDKREAFSGRWNLWLNRLRQYFTNDTESVGSDDSLGFIEMLFYDYMFDANEYLSHVASEYFVLTNEADKYCRDLNVKGGVVETAWFNFLLPKSMNKELEQIGTAFSDYFNRRCLSYSYFISVHTAIAVHAYENKYGKQLESIVSLVPEFLSQEPLDYMTGELLGYSAHDRWFFASGVEQDNTEGSEKGIYDSSCKANEGCWSQPTVRLTPVHGESNYEIADEECEPEEALE